MLVLAILGSFLFSLKRLRGWALRVQKTTVGFVISEVVILAMLVLSLIFMINTSYSPFLYSQF